MKKLIILSHPNINNSNINKRFKEELEKYTDRYDLRLLYDIYPDANIDIAAEQSIVENYDTIVYQFPLYWYNCPPLMKKWFDDVLQFGWAFGADYRMAGKK